MKTRIKEKYTIPYTVPHYLEQVLENKFSNILSLIGHDLWHRIKDEKSFGSLRNQLIKNYVIDIGFKLTVRRKDTK